MSEMWANFRMAEFYTYAQICLCSTPCSAGIEVEIGLRLLPERDR